MSTSAEYMEANTSLAFSVDGRDLPRYGIHPDEPVDGVVLLIYGLDNALVVTGSAAELSAFANRVKRSRVPFGQLP